MLLKNDSSFGLCLDFQASLEYVLIILLDVAIRECRTRSYGSLLIKRVRPLFLKFRHCPCERAISHVHLNLFMAMIIATVSRFTQIFCHSCPVFGSFLSQIRECSSYCIALFLISQHFLYFRFITLFLVYSVSFSSGVGASTYQSAWCGFGGYCWERALSSRVTGCGCGLRRYRCFGRYLA